MFNCTTQLTKYSTLPRVIFILRCLGLMRGERAPLMQRARLRRIGVYAAMLAAAWLATGCLPLNLWPPNAQPLTAQPPNAQPLTAQPPNAAAALTPTPIFTATPVWFPPTATFTPLPPAAQVITPTLDARPSHGALLWSDDFEKPEYWSLGRTAAGSAALGKSELSLAIAQSKGYLYSLRQETALGDFYLEITAAPSLCRGADEYGVLVRAASGQSFFRFGITCQGQARLDRVLDGAASSPQPPAYFGFIPPGAPSRSVLGVWAAGKELRFYANDQLLFTIHDASLPRGAMGVYARAAGDGAVTVNFSALNVYAVR